MQFLMQLLQGQGQRQQPQVQQPNALDILQATDPDPVGTANKLSSLPSTSPGSQNPFATGFFNSENSAASMSPEARLASQGNSAMSQWAQLGGMPGVDGSKIKGMLGAKAAVAGGAPPRTDVGEIRGPEAIPVAPPPQVGSWMGSPASGWQLLGPTEPGSGGGNILNSLPPGTTPASTLTEAPMPLVQPIGKGRKPRNPFGGGNFGFGAGGGKPAFGY